jgi:iron complex transport system substrate-binding protein
LRPTAALACLIAWISVASTGLAQGTVVDALGRTVSVASTPTRVVAMMASHTETVCALGACHLLVGVDDFTTFPREADGLPRLGSPYDGNLEAIVALEPDLVLVDAYSGLAEALANVGIPTYAGTPESLSEIDEVVIAIGILMGREEEAAHLVSEIARGLGAHRRAPPGPDDVTAFLELDASPYSAGPSSYLGELLTLAGANNVVPKGEVAFPLVEVESILAADPDVILLLDAPYGVTAADVARRPGWANVSAVRRGRVVALSSAEVDLMSRAGPRVVEALALLVELVHGSED